jgi:CDP-diacylglycerol--glycerol-3-phosphate 3-phosphatidyltransferase
VNLNVPKAITASRLLFAGVFGYLLFAGAGRTTLLAVFGLAAVSDWLDGYFARRLDQVTPGGAVLDQYIDRVFTALIVGFLLVHALVGDGAWESAFERRPSMPILLGLAYARDLVALPGIAIVLSRGKRLYHVEYIGKVATFVQSLVLAVIIFQPAWAWYPALACAAVGVVSAANYIRYSLRDEPTPSGRFG